jgi:hypothetical protein
VEGSCEHGNEPSGSIECWEVLECLSDSRLPKKDSAPCSYFYFVATGKRIKDGYLENRVTTFFRHF